MSLTSVERVDLQKDKSSFRTNGLLNIKVDDTFDIRLNLLQKGTHNRIGLTKKFFSLLVCFVPIHLYLAITTSFNLKSHHMDVQMSISKEIK